MANFQQLKKNKMKSFKILLIISFISNFIQCKSQSSIPEIFYNNLKNEFSECTFIKKEEFKNINYFQSFVSLLNKKNDEQIVMTNPVHLAFEIVNNNNDTYRINFITFDVQNDINRSKVYSGQFDTKALISYIYILKKMAKDIYYYLINSFEKKI